MMHVQHACAVAVSDEQLWEMSALFVAEGLAGGERVLYFEDESAHLMLARLADDGVSTAEPLRTGQLTIGPTSGTRTVLSGPVAGLEQMMLGAIDDSLARGYPGVRVAGQADWAVGRAGGVGLADYDVGIRRVLAQRPAARALCLYDHRRYPGELVALLRDMHTHEISTPSVYDDGLLRVTRAGPAEVRLAGEADHSNRGIVGRVLRGALEEAQWSPAAPPTVTVDLSSLRFLDVGEAAALVRAAGTFPSTHRLVLRGARARVHRVLERCGAPLSPQLDMLGPRLPLDEWASAPPVGATGRL